MNIISSRGIRVLHKNSFAVNPQSERIEAASQNPLPFNYYSSLFLLDWRLTEQILKGESEGRPHMKFMCSRQDYEKKKVIN